MPIEEKTDDMHQNRSQQAISQMPQIACSGALYLTPINQLTKHGVDEVPNPPQDRALVCHYLWRVYFAEWHLQYNHLCPQECLQIGQPIIAVTQHHFSDAFKQIWSHFSIQYIGWSQKHAREHPWSTELSIQPKTIKGLLVSMIFAIAGFPSKMNAPGYSCETAAKKRNTIHDEQRWIIGDYLVAQPAPQVFFERPQTGCLPYKSASMKTTQSREKVSRIALEGTKELLLLRQAQVTSHDLHGDHFTIREIESRTSGSQSLVFENHWHHLVNRAKTWNNKVVQVHGDPPQKGVSVFLRIPHELFLWQGKLAHRVI